MELTEYESKTYKNAIEAIEKIEHQLEINGYGAISVETALKNINEIITTHQNKQNELMELFSN